MKKKIALVHKFNESSIEFIDSIGGIPNPSLAFIPTDVPFTDYGEYALLKNPREIDFNTHPAYPIDIYSAITPEIRYELQEDVWSDLNERCQQAAQAYGLKRNDSFNIVTIASPTTEIQTGNLRARMAVKDKLGAMLLYLHEIGKEMPVAVHRTSYDAPYPAISESIISSAINKGIFTLPSHEQNPALTQHIVRELQDALSAMPPLESIHDRAQKRLVQRTKGFINNFIESKIYDEDGVSQLYISAFNAIESAAKSYAQNDKSEDLAILHSDLKFHFDSYVSNEGYDAWVKHQLKDAFGKPWFYRHDPDAIGDDYESLLGIAKEEATLENIAKDMNLGKEVVGNQAFASVIKVAASVSERFESYQDVEAKIDHFISGDDYDALKKEKESELLALIEDLAPYSKFQEAVRNDRLFYKTSMMERFAESKMQLDNSMNDSYFVDKVPSELVARVDAFRKELQNLRFPYFEMKSTDPMKLSDFDAVIVPKTISRDNFHVFKKAGLKIIACDVNNPYEWTKAINSQQSLLIGNGEEFKLEKSKKEAKELTF